MRDWLILVSSVALMVTAQTIWKLGLTRLGSFDLQPLSAAVLLRLLSRWEIWCGLAIFAVTTIMWLYLLSRMQLSQLYPMMSLSYVFAFFVGWIWLGEAFSWGRLAGIAVICCGIYIVASAGRA